MAKNKRQHKTNHKPAQLRIIGGRWRGRKLNFAETDGLRPTPDRVRETLFNWLAPVIGGARCLDLFAGSGALGFEALSRGAAYACLIEANKTASEQLQQNLTVLDCGCADVYHQRAEQWLAHAHPDQGFHVIFLDPPFHQNLVQNCVNAIDQQQILADRGWVYLEMASNELLPQVPAHWQLYREKTAGQVCYRLFEANRA